MIKTAHLTALAIMLSLVISPLAFAGERSKSNESGERDAETRAESNLSLKNNFYKYDSEKQNNQTLSGKIIAVSRDNITFKSENETAPRAINVSDTEIKNLYGTPLQVSDIKTGDKIRIFGSSSITDISNKTQYKKMEGRVATIDGTSLTISAGKNKLFTINTSTETEITKNGRSAAFSDIKTGSKIKVAGNWDKTTNTITADNISITVKLYAIYFKGTLTEKNGNILTISGNNGKTYTVDAGNAIIVYKYFGRGNISELNIGDKLQIIGKHEKSSTFVIAGLVRDYSSVKPAPAPSPSPSPSSSPTVPTPTATTPAPTPTPSPTATPNPSFTAQQIAAHNTASNCWVIMNSKVYNITSYIPNHPGGTGTITPYCGKDAASAFGSISHSQNANNLLASFFVGNLQ